MVKRDFMWAIEQLKAGKKVSRKGWGLHYWEKQYEKIVLSPGKHEVNLNHLVAFSDEDWEIHNSRKKYVCYECNKIMFKKESCKCSECGKILCPKHCYSYVDESNIAITKNSPELCMRCYKRRYSK